VTEKKRKGEKKAYGGENSSVKSQLSLISKDYNAVEMARKRGEGKKGGDVHLSHLEVQEKKKVQLKYPDIVTGRERKNRKGSKHSIERRECKGSHIGGRCGGDQLPGVRRGNGDAMSDGKEGGGKGKDSGPQRTLNSIVLEGKFHREVQQKASRIESSRTMLFVPDLWTKGKGEIKRSIQ